MALTRDAILSAKDLPQETVDIPEWGGPVIVRGLTAAERTLFEKACLQGKGRNAQMTLDNVAAKLAVRAIVDEQGERIFSDADAESLGQKSAAAVYAVFEVAARLSRLTAKDVEELAGESAGELGSTSPTSSPRISASGT